MSFDRHRAAPFAMTMQNENVIGSPQGCPFAMTMQNENVIGSPQGCPLRDDDAK
ncbi:MAG: hypothetical protein MJZ85_06420 [Bacteroidales bacterium]|nr:hypothetical protein [Bacteroidales bacterium]